MRIGSSSVRFPLTPWLLILIIVESVSYKPELAGLPDLEGGKLKDTPNEVLVKYFTE